MISIINDWEILDRRKPWNWECFHLIEAYVERDNVCRTFDFRFALLGFGVSGSIPLPDRLVRRNGTRDRLFGIADSLGSEGMRSDE